MKTEERMAEYNVSAVTAAPVRWKMVPLGEVLEGIVGGGTPSRSNPAYWEGSIPWLTVKDMRSRRPQDSIDHISENAVRDSATNLIPADTVIIATRIGLGKVIRVPYNATINQDLKALITKPVVDKGYLEYWIVSIANYLESIGSGTTVKGIRLEQLRSLSFPLAPLDQQKRIVAEIEKQFSRLDEAVANLKRVKANLKRYKAAVLKAAVAGRLTEAWRKQHPETEPASELLQRILAERRAKWEQAKLAKMQDKGKTPKDDTWKMKYSKPAALDTTDLPELPKGWVWARLDAIAALKGGITVDSKRKDPTARSVPYLRVANVQRGYLDLAEVKFIEAPESEIDALRLLCGDILFNEGGDRDKLGRGWIWEDQLADCIHQNHVFRARLYLDQLSPKLVSWWGNSFGKDYFSREGKQTTNLASINLTKLSAFPVPLPPIAEQQEIVAEVDRRLSLADEAEAQVNANLKRALVLRGSVLANAFHTKQI